MAAVVTGNTAILKPSSLTPAIAARFVDLCAEAGMPAGVVNFLGGPGEEVGMGLVAHPRVRFISFTGSREVGELIYRTASVVAPGQKWLKRVVAEMGARMRLWLTKLQISTRLQLRWQPVPSGSGVRSVRRAHA